MIIKEKKFVIKKTPKTIYFDLSKKLDHNLNNEKDFIIKLNKFLAEHTIKKTKLVNYCANINMEQYSRTQKTVKPINHTNLYLIFCKYWT